MSQSTITATLVPESNIVEFTRTHLTYDAPACSFSRDLSEFLEKHKDNHAPVVSIDLIHAYLCDKARGYDGSPCRFYELSNGGFYMAPEMKTLEVERGHVSGDAAGIIITLCALADCLMKRINTREAATTEQGKAYTPDDEKLYSQYYALRDYAQEHTESAMIISGY